MLKLSFAFDSSFSLDLDLCFYVDLTSVDLRFALIDLFDCFKLIFVDFCGGHDCILSFYVL